MNSKSFNKAMGAVISRLRKTHGLTLAQLGAPLGVTYQQAQKSTAGVNAFSAHQISLLAALFGLTVADLYEQAGVKAHDSQPSPAEADGFLAARYVSRIADEKTRRIMIDALRKFAYEGSAA